MVAVLNRETTATVRAKEMVITPRMAREWLEKTAPNRRVSEHTVEKYAADMLEGRWLENGATIVIGASGKVLDGQHRLHAIAHAEVALPMIVVTGVADEAFKTIDTGRSRSVADVLRVMGYPNHILLAAASRHQLIYADTGEFVASNAVNVSHQRILANAVAQADEFNEAINAATPAFKTMKSSSAVWTVLWMVLGEIDALDRDVFFDGVAVGANLSERSPVFALRRYFIDASRRSRRSVIAANLQAALIIKAWNKFRAHESVGVLAWRQDEAFPEPI